MREDDNDSQNTIVAFVVVLVFVFACWSLGTVFQNQTEACQSKHGVLMRTPTSFRCVVTGQ